VSVRFQAVKAAITQARRELASSRALFREGLVSECHRHMLAAQRALLEAWCERRSAERASSSERATDQELALAALAGAGYRRLPRLRASLVASENVSEASLGADTAWRDLQPIWAEVERLSRFTMRYFTPPEERLRARRQRTVLAVLAAVVVVILVRQIRERPRAHSSLDYSDNHAAACVLDGLGATEWLLPDDTLGWVDVTFPSARTVHRVRLFNAHNVFYLDRATGNVRVTAFSEKNVVATASGGFKRLDPEQSILDLQLEAKEVTRVRVEVLSFFKRGAGLAEIEVY